MKEYLENNANLKFRYEAEKGVIYEVKSDIDVCMVFEEHTALWLLKILNNLD